MCSLAQNLVKNLCQHFKESISLAERCTFHTSAIVNKQRNTTKGYYKWVPNTIPIETITHNPLKALKTIKTGGRGPDGRVWNHRRAGGNARRWRVVDNFRTDLGPGKPRVERVIYTRYDPNRSAFIAAVAGGDRKRFILASENMKAGDLITTSCELTKLSVMPKEGDSHPLGNLPIGTLVHNIEKEPGQGGSMMRAAGSSAFILRHHGDKTVIKLPSKTDMTLSSKCMATIGKVSNPRHMDIPIGSPNKLRWLGIQPRSGVNKARWRKIKIASRQEDYKNSFESNYIRFTF